jgi:Polyketide cyclase / dehydrase and lipid transport
MGPELPRGGVRAHIRRPADEVFAYVGDAENNPRWHSYVVETQWLDDGPMRVGRRGRQVSKILGLRYEVVAEIVVWDPPRRAVWQTVAGGATVRTECLVEPDGDGCILTFVTEGEFAAGPLNWLGPIAIRVFKRQALGDVKRLIVALESGTENRG